MVVLPLLVSFAIAGEIGWTGHPLSADLIAVRLLVARLGGVSAALRIGLLAMEELQARTAVPKARLP